MNDYAAFYREIAALEREASRGNRRQRRSGAAWESTPEAQAEPEVPRFSPREVRQLERETEVENARQRARREYSPLPDEFGPLVPITAIVGDLAQAPIDATLAREANDPAARRRLGERDTRWARGAEQAGEDVLAEGHGGQLMQFFSDLPQQMDEAERARLEAGGEDTPLARLGAVAGGFWTGMAAAPRDARGEVAAQDVIRTQQRSDAADAMERGDDVAANRAARSGQMAEQAGDVAAGEDFWYNAPWAAEFIPGVGLVDLAASGGRFGGRQVFRASGQEVPELLARPDRFSETQRLGARTGEVNARGDDVLYSATDNARGWRNNALVGGGVYLAADAADGEVGDDPAAAMLGGAAMIAGRRFIPNIDSAIPAEVQNLMRQGEIGPDGARNYTPRPRQRLTVDGEGRVAMDYEGSFNTGDGASVGETRSVMRGAREALDDDIATTRRSEYSWTPNDERQAALYRSTFERDTPTNYAFSETPGGEMRLRRLGAEFEPDPLEAVPVADDAPFGFEGAPGAGRIIDAEAAPAPARNFEAAVRDPETGRVYTGQDHLEAIDSAPDEAVRARLQAAYEAADEDPSVIGFQVDGQFMGRKEGLAALSQRAGRSRQVRIGAEQVNRDGSVTPRSEIDWENGSNRLPADDEWFNNLAGMPTPPRMNIVREGGIPGRSADDMLRNAPDGGAAGRGNRTDAPNAGAAFDDIRPQEPSPPGSEGIFAASGPIPSRRRLGQSDAPAGEVRLTDEQRAVLSPDQSYVMERRLQGANRRQIADEMQTSENAVGVQYYNAQRKLAAAGFDMQAPVARIGREPDGLTERIAELRQQGLGAAAIQERLRITPEQYASRLSILSQRGVLRPRSNPAGTPERVNLPANTTRNIRETLREPSEYARAAHTRVLEAYEQLAAENGGRLPHNFVSTIAERTGYQTANIGHVMRQMRAGVYGEELAARATAVGTRTGRRATNRDFVAEAMRDPSLANNPEAILQRLNAVRAEQGLGPADIRTVRSTMTQIRRLRESGQMASAVGAGLLGGGLLLADEAQAQESVDGMLIDPDAELPSYRTAVGTPQAYGEYAIQEFSDGTRYVFRVDRSGGQVSLEPLGALRGTDFPSPRIGEGGVTYDNTIPSRPYEPPPREEAPRRLNTARPALAAGAGLAASLLVPGRYGNATRMATSAATALAADTALGGDWDESLPLAAGVAGGGEFLRYGVDDVSRRLGNHGEDIMLRLDPEFRARRDAFAETLPHEIPTVRVAETENFHGEIQRPDEGLFGGKPFVVSGDEMRAQGYSYNRPVENMPTQREQFLDADPGVQRAWMDRAEQPQIAAAADGADPERVARGLEVRRRLGEQPPAREQADPFIQPETGSSVFGEPRRQRAPRAPLPPLADRAEAAGAQGAMRGVRAGPMREIADDLGIATEGRSVGDLRKAIVRELGRRFDSTREMVAFLARYGVTTAAIGIGVEAYTEQKQQRRLN